MKKQIPLLRVTDIDVRIQNISEDGYAIMLLYKNARVDMRILDEVFGSENWQRHHVLINGNLFCTVSVWDEEKKQWIEKQDVGVESQTQAEKGQASDSFKRACFNWGIGRELYNAPFVRVKMNASELYRNKAGKNATKTSFIVTAMKYDPKTEAFTELVIVDNHGKERYRLGKKVEAPKEEAKPWVAKNGNETMVLNNNGNYYPLSKLSVKQLNDVINEAKYADCHNEARQLMLERTNG